MLKGLLIAPFAALLVAGTAHAASLQTLTLNHDQNDRGLHADVVEVQTHRNTFSIIAQDALYGGIFGAVDAATSADRAFPVVERPDRDRGFSRGAGVGKRF